MSIYSFVDAIAVGRSEGPAGAAAMAVITPLYGILIFLGILCGIGGAVLMTNAKGEGQEEKGNSYFTVSLALIALLAAMGWVAMGLFHRQIFTFFGADETTYAKVMEYARWIIRFFPVFLAPAFLGAFIRNDGAPGLAMGAVLTGGIVNVFGDWFLVFPLGMGIQGAAIATVIGNCLQVVILCSHFFRKKCHLRLVKPNSWRGTACETLTIGFSSSVLELGNILLPILLNNQMMRYGGAAALAVYGVVSTVSSLLQSLFSGVGQAIQPLVSTNFGAKQTDRVWTTLRMSLVTVIAMGLFFTALGELFPLSITRLFITSVTEEVLAVAPVIIRSYFLVFLFLGITVLATYHLQSTLRFQLSIVVSLLRSVVVSGMLLLVLPVFFDFPGVLAAMPVSEWLMAVVSLALIGKGEPELQKR